MKIEKLPACVKWSYASFMAILIPTYWIQYGPSNFLWICDITLLLTFIAIMTEWRLLSSMTAIGGLVFGIIWIIDFLAALCLDIHLTATHPNTHYMFDGANPLWLRAFSLFLHVVLPPLLLWLIMRVGYDGRAWLIQTLVAWGIITVTWFFTDPSENINMVFSYQSSEWLIQDPAMHLTIESIAVAAVYLVTHLLFQRKFPPPPQTPSLPSSCSEGSTLSTAPLRKQ